MKQWWNRLGNAVLVTVFTLAIWLYAEGRAVSRYPAQRVQVQLTTALNEAVYPRDPVPVTLDVVASKSQYASFREMIKRPVELTVAGVGNAEGRGDGSRVIDLREALTRVFAEQGINIASAEPTAVPIRIQRLASAVFEPQLSATVPRSRLGSVSFSPETIEVTGPVDLVTLPESQRRITVPISPEMLDEMPPNVPQSLTVVGRLPEALASDPWVSPTEPRITVTLTVAQQTRRATLDRVPILLTVSPKLLERFRVRLANDQLVWPDLEVAGPAEQVARLVAGDAEVALVLRPSANQLEQGVDRLPVRVQLPDGVLAQNAPADLPVIITRIE